MQFASADVIEAVEDLLFTGDAEGRRAAQADAEEGGVEVLEISGCFDFDAGFDFAVSRMVARTLLGTCSNVSGSIEYEARPFESERIAVA